MLQVANFQINFYQLLNEYGEFVANIDPKIIDFWCDPAKELELLKMYECMQQARLFDAKAINLQKIGSLGTYPSCFWHEAIGVAIGSSMEPADLFCPYYRDLATLLWRGVSMEEILAYWGGYLHGNNFKYATHDFPFCVPIASQTLHAAGAAFAFKYQKLPHVVVTTVGDGGTSRGDFYEALNIAKVWELPIVFVIINNQFAISTPIKAQTGAKTLAQKAIAAGITGEQVDGNDLLGLKTRLTLAITKARNFHEPMVIEALTYRMNDHTTADDASRYREEATRQQQLKFDPLIRFKLFLTKFYDFSEEIEAEIIARCQAGLKIAVENYLNLPDPQPAGLYKHLYKNLPVDLKF